MLFLIVYIALNTNSIHKLVTNDRNEIRVVHIIKIYILCTRVMPIGDDDRVGRA